MIPVQKANAIPKGDPVLGSRLLHQSQQSVEPLHLKKSLSVSSLLKFSPEKEALQDGRYQRGYSPQRLLVPGSLAPPQRGDDFWDSLCTHYNYLMDEGLIATCREANSELSSKVEGDCDWSFTEFIQKFNELHDTLHTLLEEVTSTAETKDSNATVGILEKLQSAVFRCKQFKEQSQQLGQRYPDMKDEINRRVNLLNNKWETLEQAIHPHKPQATQEALYNEVSHEMRCLRRWLRDVEDRLHPTSDGFGGWTLDDLQFKHQGQQVLQKEIESRGQLVSSLLHLCERLQRESASCQREAAGELPVASRLPWDAERICRVASNLEKRWHALWLRSLEEQCRVEELIRKCKAGLLPDDPSLESSFGEEPPHKYPRLTDGLWYPPSGKKTMSQQAVEQLEAAPDQDLRQNDKAVMVGTTGIAQLKAEYGTSPLGRFEIIQDVGYSSESSTHLSGEDNHEFIQVYSYSPATKGRTIVTEYKVCRDEKGGRVAPSEPAPPLDATMDWQLTSEEEEDDDLFLDNLPAALTSSPKRDSSGGDWALDVSESTTLVDRSLYDDAGTFSVRQLVTQAEQLVREESRKRNLVQKAVPAGLCTGGEKFLKSERVQEWLQGCNGGKARDTASIGQEECSAQQFTSTLLPQEKDTARAIESSCDASGEYTTNESSENSGNESGAEGSTQHHGRRLSHSGTGSVETVVPLVSVGPGPGDNPGSPLGCRVVLRSKKRNKRDRPWSVTELYQASSQLGLSPFSTSEGALNVLGSSRLISGSGFLRPHKSPSQDQVVPQQGSPLRRHHRRHRSRASLPLQVHCSSLPQTEGQSSSSDGHSSSRRGYSEGSGGHRHARSSYNTSSDSAAQCSSQSSCRSRRASSCHSSQGHCPGHHNKNKKRKPVSSDETQKIHERLSSTISADASSTGVEAFSSQLEDQSSVSDQAWDSYEDPPYLSEPYSEQTPDADQIKRLIDFGDDYRAFICSDASSSISGRTASRTMRGRSLTNNTQASPGVESETDSDVEELQCLLQDSSRALQFARNTLQSQKTENGMLRHSESVELLATCQTHLKCLQVISQHLDPSYHLLSSNSQENLLQDLLSGWGMLQVEVLSSQENGDQFQEVQQEIHALSKKMDTLAQVLEQTDNNYTSIDSIQKRIGVLQDSLAVLHETKTWLLSVNLRVHRCLTEYGLTYSTMKDSITQLYASWDDIYEQNGSQLTELQEAYNRWQHFTEDRQKLEHILVQEELEQISLGKVDYWQVAERNHMLNSAEDLLITLHQEAQALRPVLREESQAWVCIKEQLEVLKDRLHNIKEEHPQRVQEIHRIPPETKEKEVVPVAVAKVQTPIPKSTEERRKRSRFWRVLRAALPLQVVMVLLYCLAWLMEPQCCDFLNSMHFTFSPTLRYLKGPPPT